MSVADFVVLELKVFVGGLLAILGYQMLTGRINTRGLIRDKRTGQLSPGRIQLLVFTLAGAMYYGMLLASQPDRFPPVPDALLYLIGGSQAAYLSGKAALFRRVAAWLKKASPIP